MAKNAKPVKSNEDRLLAIYDANLDDIEKEFNLAGSLNLPKFSSGILVYDLTIGGGYVPGGHYISTGKEGSSKSTACMTAVGEISRTAIPVAEYRDAESAVDSVYSAFCMGVSNLNEIFGEQDSNNKWVIRPRVRYYDENVIETTFTSIVKTLNRMPDKRFRAADKTWYHIIDPKDKRIDKRFMEALGKPDDKLKKLSKGLLWYPTDNALPQAFFALDSYASMVSLSEDEEGDAKNGLALEARDFAKSLRRLAGKMRRKAVTCQGVNQIRERPMVRFGNPEYEPGGNALKHYSTCRNKFDARVVPQEWRGGDESSEFMREPSVYGKGKDTYMYKYIRNTKNKHATPRLDGWIRIWTRDNNGQGRGIDPVFDVAQFCVMTGLAEYSKERGTGRVVQFIKNKNADNLPKMLDALVKGGKSVPWQDFKKIVLSKRPFATRELKDEAEKLCKKLNVPHSSLFSNCQQFLGNGRANDAMYHTNASQATKVKDLEA